MESAVIAPEYDRLEQVPNQRNRRNELSERKILVVHVKSTQAQIVTVAVVL